MKSCATCVFLKIMHDNDIRVYHCKRKIERNVPDTKITSRELAEGCLKWKLRSYYEKG